jgi:hypothetical protein
MGNPARPPVQVRWWATAVAGGPLPLLLIHDLNGRLRRTLALGPDGAGTMAWAGDDDNGRPLPSGMYFVTLDAAEASVTRKLVLIWR